MVDRIEYWPEVVTESSGQEWVQIVDDAGFAGFDPTDAQVVEAVVAKYGELPTPDQLTHLASIAVNTTHVHENLVVSGEREIAGFIGTNLFMRNKDVAAAGQHFMLSGDKEWLDIKRTTEDGTIMEGVA